MKEIKTIMRPERLFSVLRALREMPRLPGITVSQVRGFVAEGPPILKAKRSPSWT
jgi:nitrogen regulatory protein PII